jgi:dienelactone hydrolase
MFSLFSRTVEPSLEARMTLQLPKPFMQNTSATRRWQFLLTALMFVMAESQTSAVEFAVFDSNTVTYHELPNEAPVERFCLADHEFDYSQSFMRRWPDVADVFEVSFPSPVSTNDIENNTVACEYFRPIGDGQFPGVIVLHILGGDFELSRTICRTFASNGIGALFLKMPYYGPRRPPNSKRRMISPDLDETVDGMTQAVLDIRRATAWLGSRAEIDDDRLGITGISLGGIVGCLAAANEPRLGRCCFVLAGGDLPVIVMESDEMKKVRDHYDGKEVNRERVVKLLGQVDPLTYAKKLADREVLMFNAKRDNVVPRACTEKLWEAMNKPSIEWWNADHYSAILYLPKGLVRITKFFGEATWGSRAP